MQAHKFLLAITTIFLAGQISAQVADPKANTSTKSEAVESEASTTAEKVVTDAVAEALAKETLFINSKTAFTLEAKDDSSTVDYIEWKTKAGDYRRFTAPIRLSEEGVTEIQYRSVDKVGNVEAPKILNVTVDNTAPKVTLQPAEPFFVLNGVPFTSKNNSYTVVAEDKVGVQAVQYAINSEAAKPYSDPIKLEATGANTIKYSATDKAGNSSPESSVVITIDDVKPTVEIVPSLPLVDIAGKPYAKRGNVFHVNAIDKESGLKKVLVKLDAEAEFRPYVEGITVETQGEHKIQAKAIDNVGNESATVEVSFFVDLTPPSSVIQKTTATETPAATTPEK
ncbi:multi-beta-barrel domain surface protein OmpL47 [Leptospira sp. 'Mane']|uniref:multi-beta-barrel domain surface protein OmpL47 n=1 Tax=Leptospira sp. 'Mane' TaxID=3387407 RepID=UPI00398AC9D8